MCDMFWEIPADEALTAVSCTVGLRRKQRRGKTIWFSLWQEAKCLDRTRKSADRQFIAVEESHLQHFVQFLGSLTLNHHQGGREVPIGVHLGLGGRIMGPLVRHAVNGAAICTWFV